MDDAPTTASLEGRFAGIYRDYGGLLAKVALSFVAEPADRDDLFQEMLISIWRALPQFDERAKLSTYVYRVALSSALNWKRARQRYRARVEHYGRLRPELGEPASAGERERLQWLYARIRELPPLDRSLILLSLEKVGYGEMAAITGLTESNIGVRLHRIKQALVKKLEETRHEL